MVSSEIKRKLKKFRIALIKAGIRVQKLVLYGSYANGKNRTYSDIDVAVISRDFGKDRFKEGVKLFRIASRIDPRIEPLPLSTTSFKEDTWLPLIYEIRKNGIELKVT